jgi:cation transport regulator
MPYKNTSDLPDNVQNVLPEHGQKIYLEAYNHALEEYQDPQKRRTQEDLETIAHKVAWNAVKQKYKKDETSGQWQKK